MYLLNLTSPAVGVGGAANGTIAVPIGAQRVTGMYFNPAISYDITVTRSKGNKDVVVENFRTSIGTIGYVPIRINRVGEEVFQIAFVNQSGAINDLNLALVCE